MEDLWVGCAAGGSGDRVDAAQPIVAAMVKAGKRGVLIFENLAERTLAFAQLARRANPNAGYEPLLDEEVRPVLADCMRHGIAIVSNFGGANPRGAAAHILRIAEELGLPRPRIAVIEGDDLSDARGQALLRPFLPPGSTGRQFVSANVYQGAFEIADALKAGAQVVVTGRVADPSLTRGPALAQGNTRRSRWQRRGFPIRRSRAGFRTGVSRKRTSTATLSTRRSNTSGSRTPATRTTGRRTCIAWPSSGGWIT